MKRDCGCPGKSIIDLALLWHPTTRAHSILVLVFSELPSSERYGANYKLEAIALAASWDLKPGAQAPECACQLVSLQAKTPKTRNLI